VIFAGCARLPEGDGDERGTLTALAAAGVAVRWAVWGDPDVDFAAAGLVVLRTTWDYSQQRHAFLDWCATVPRLRNPLEVVRWNTDKAYLLDLAAGGIPIVPTRLVAPGERPRWPNTEFVLKPAVGAGSLGAARFMPKEADRAAEHLARLHAGGQRVLLQPYQARVDAEGETALVFLGGRYSHSFTKAAMLGRSVDGSGLFVTEELATAEPEPGLRAVAEQALDVAAHRLRVPRHALLYARVDLVRGDDGAPALLELELTEPSLGMRQAGPEADARFACAIRTQLG
jgi:hypothetical protein